MSLAASPLAFPFTADGDVGAPGARSPIHYPLSTIHDLLSPISLASLILL